MPYEYGLQYNVKPNDVVLGRKTNEDGTVTRTHWYGPGDNNKALAWQAYHSPAPLGAEVGSKRAVRRLVGPTMEMNEEDEDEPS